MDGVNKSSAIRAVIAATDAEPIIFTTGYACRIARAIADRPNHFYMTGSMGLASSIGVGVACQSGRTTVVVDGDGSLMMNPSGLLLAGAMHRLKLVHVLLDDGQYASTGGQPVPSGHADMCAWAAASGYRRTDDALYVEDLARLLAHQLVDCAAPTFIRAALTEPDAPVPDRVDPDLEAHAQRFQRHLLIT